MELLAKVGIVGAVLGFVCLVGLLSFVLLVALPPLFGGELYKPYMSAAYVGLGIGVLAFLGLLVYMVSLILALTKEK